MTSLLYPESLLEDLRRLVGGQHAFLVHLARDEARAHREVIEDLHTRLRGPLAERLCGLLTSLDNRKFFQGYAELVVMTLLARSGFEVRELLQPGPVLQAVSASQGELAVSVLSFIHQARLLPDRSAIDKLLAALDRVPGRERMILVVHRLQSADLDTEPIRRAVEAWLLRLERGEWTARSASYEDGGIHLEFCLTGALSQTGRRVSASMGPFWSPASIAAVDNRVLADLDRWRLSRHAGRRLMLAAVADRPWRLSPGYVRDFLLGRARRMERIDEDGVSTMELEYPNEGSPSVFRDPLYQDLAAFLWLGRLPEEPSRLQAQAFLNPWAERPLDPDVFEGCERLASHRGVPRAVVLRWSRVASRTLRIHP
jgi:hypothetical protein